MLGKLFSESVCTCHKLLLLCAVCGMLLVPLVMERYKPQPEQLGDKARRVWLELTHLLKVMVAQLQQRLNRARARRNR